MVKHITVDKKEDAGGIGIEAVVAEQREQSNVWWHDAYAGRLANLTFGVDIETRKEGGKKKGDKKSKDGNKKAKKGSDPTDAGGSGRTAQDILSSMPSFEELFKATGGARLGMRARRRQTGQKCSL